MKIFVGYHCEVCGTDFDTDSRNLIDHADPECPVCGCDDKIQHVYADEDIEEE